MSPAGRRLVAISAHADDAELNAGGFMAGWVAAGGEVDIVMATNNCSGPMIPEEGDEAAMRRLPAAATTAVRHREQDAAAGLIGARVHHLGYPQRWFFDGQRQRTVGFGNTPDTPAHVLGQPCILIACRDEERIAQLGALLAGLQPALILTQTPLDADPEHHAVATMVWLAWRQTLALRDVPLRFWTPSTSSPGGLVDPHYDLIEDITAHYEMKLALCGAHASQWTLRRREIVRNRAAYWGARIGVRYAEPFRTAWQDDGMG